MLTIDEQEARAYQAGDTALADALAQLADAHAEIDNLRALVAEAVDYVTDDAWRERAQLADARAEIDNFRALLRDALDGEAGDDAWRERARAAIED